MSSLTQTRTLFSDKLEALLRAGQFSQLIGNCQRILLSEQSCEEDRYYANKFLAYAYLKTGNLAQAARYLSELEKSRGAHYDCLALKAYWHLIRAEVQSAKVYFEEVLEKFPCSPEALAGLGWCLMECDPAQAWQHFSRALDCDPSYRDALRGMCKLPYPKDGGIDLERRLRQALEIEPLDSEIRIALAVCLVSIGKTQDALREISKVTLTDPTSTAAKELRERLVEIRTTTPPAPVSE